MLEAEGLLQSPGSERTPDREARCQARARLVNEWIEAANESMGAHSGTDPFRCECGDRACRRSIALSHREYEAVRGYATRFVLAGNHENPESDRVVAEHERYTVVEKLVGGASRHAYGTNPR
jgi:hypothetical protein